MENGGKWSKISKESSTSNWTSLRKFEIQIRRRVCYFTGTNGLKTTATKFSQKFGKGGCGFVCNKKLNNLTKEEKLFRAEVSMGTI